MAGPRRGLATSPTRLHGSSRSARPRRVAPRPARRPAGPSRARGAWRGTARGSGRRSSPAATRAARARSREVAGCRRSARRKRGAAPGQQQAAQHRPERARLDWRAGAGGDRLGDRVGLLGGDAALLDREARPSPAAQTSISPATAPWSSIGMKPFASWVTPASRGPSSRGSATTRWWGGPRGATERPPSANASGVVETDSSIPRVSSSSRTARSPCRRRRRAVRPPASRSRSRRRRRPRRRGTTGPAARARREAVSSSRPRARRTSSGRSTRRRVVEALPSAAASVGPRKQRAPVTAATGPAPGASRSRSKGSSSPPRCGRRAVGVDAGDDRLGEGGARPFREPAQRDVRTCPAPNGSATSSGR